MIIITIYLLHAIEQLNLKDSSNDNVQAVGNLAVTCGIYHFINICIIASTGQQAAS